MLSPWSLRGYRSKKSSPKCKSWCNLEFPIFYFGFRYVNYDTIDWGAGKISGTTFCNDEEISKVCSYVYQKYMLMNPLHPDIFTSLRKMEAEIIQVTQFAAEVWYAQTVFGGLFTQLIFR